MNADGRLYKSRKVLGLNSFFYCSNRVVVFLDSNGTSEREFWGTIQDGMKEEMRKWENSFSDDPWKMFKYSMMKVMLQAYAVQLAKKVTTKNGWALTQEFFENFMLGNGEAKQYGADSLAARTIIAHGGLKATILEGKFQVGDSLAGKGEYKPEDGDLFYSIQSFSYSGEIVAINGSKYANITIVDVYDFDEIRSYGSNELAASANNAGYFAEGALLGSPFDFTISLSIPLE